MKVQDFFSIVQLGIGIHAGTAILQLTMEFGITPLERSVENISSWLDQERANNNLLEEKEEELRDIKTMIYIYRTQYANVYRKLVNITFGAALVLTFALAVMSFIADTDISPVFGIGLVLLSTVPAALTFSYLWQKSNDALAPIGCAIRRIENAIGSPGDNGVV